MSTRNVTDNLADHLAIQDLISRYSLGICQRDWHMLGEVFTEDGVWEVDGGAFSHRHEGREEVIKALKERIDTQELVMQMPHASVIEVESNRAKARVTVQEFVRFAGMKRGKGMTMLGIYHDDIVRDRDGEWRFACRHFVYSYLDLLTPCPGDVFLKFPGNSE